MCGKSTGFVVTRCHFRAADMFAVCDSLSAYHLHHLLEIQVYAVHVTNVITMDMFNISRWSCET